jgi:eukaryotic-like serine/threonine-protein kinase
MILSPGSRIVQYEILGLIGAGGMGEVYRARDSRLDRDVAIKVMAPDIAANPEMRRRFETEARAIAALSHSSIVAIHELALVEDVPVAVMELLEGQSLRERMKTGALPWREAVRMAASIADGLAAAHARGIIHRDLKPENVFLTIDGSVKILDFGLALLRHLPASNEGPTMVHTAANVVLGTFGYMAPEQVTGDPVDTRADLFALGCVIHEMVTGRPRFSGATPQEVIARLLSNSGADLAITDAVPRELSSIVARCTARAAADRFQSAADLALALRALLSGFPSIGATDDIGRASSTAVASGSSSRRLRGKSLAVIPFVNSGADPATEYLTNGITENIINSLSQLGGLRVVPRSLVFRYKALQADPAAIGMALNARTILTGRVSQQGEYLTIQAELVDTETESQLWGEQFRPKLTDLPNVQQEIAWQISEALRLKLTGAQKKKLRRRESVDPEAYQEYLKGRHFFNTWTPDGFRRALEHFERAIDRDPTYAPAYAGLGDTIGSMSYYGFVPPEDGFPRAQAAAKKAISIEPDSADAYGTLALGALFFLWNWNESEKHFKTSIRLNPNLASVRAFYAILLSTCGRHEEAIAQARAARQLDPLSPLINMGVAWALYFAGQFEQAVAEVSRMKELLHAQARDETGSVLIICNELMGRFEDAARIAKTSHCFGVPMDGEALARAWRERGAQGYWDERLAALDRAAPTALTMIHFSYGVVLAQLGRLDEAVDHLRTMVEKHHGGAVFFGVDPALAPLRGHAAFNALLTQIGVPRSPTASTLRTVSI